MTDSDISKPFKRVLLNEAFRELAATRRPDIYLVSQGVVQIEFV